MTDQNPTPGRPARSPQTVVNVSMANTNQASAEATALAVATAVPSKPGAPPKRKSLFLAYSLLALGWWGALHRIYLDRPFGRWLFFFWLTAWIGSTGFLAGAGPLLLVVPLSFIVVDAFSIPRLVSAHNALVDGGVSAPAIVGASAPLTAHTPLPGPSHTQKARSRPEQSAAAPTDLRTLLLHEAHRGDGKLTVTQAVMATGEDWDRIEACLKKMVQAGYVDVDNEPHSGVIVYVFPELVGRPVSRAPEPQLEDHP